jgi:hypothetical protein
MKAARFVLGAALAPAAVPLLYCVGLILDSGYREKRLLELLAWMTMSYLHALPLGLASTWILSRWHRLDLRHCLLAGLLLGAVGGLILAFHYSGPRDDPEPWSDRFGMSAVCSVAGFITALAFCLIAGVPWRRRDA